MKRIAVATLAGAVAVLAFAAVGPVGRLRPVHAAVVPDYGTPAAYEPQKVVYHISEGGGWFGRDHRRRLSNMENHVAAVGSGALELVVVMNGDGINLLADAAGDTALAARVDFLRAKGVHFLVCRNTLVGKQIDPASLHGLTTADIVGSGVAEVARLGMKGYAYVKP